MRAPNRTAHPLYLDAIFAPRASGYYPESCSLYFSIHLVISHHQLVIWKGFFQGHNPYSKSCKVTSARLSMEDMRTDS